MKLLKWFSTMILVLLAGCSSGGGDDQNPGTNACGTLGLQSRAYEPRIVNGTECSEAGSPVVELQLQAGDGKTYLCSGTMISAVDVLTAAHCYFPGIRRTIVSTNGRLIQAATVFIHPGVSNQTSAILNDVAVVRLVSSPGLPVVPLVTSAKTAAGDIVQIYGYGQTENENPAQSTIGTLRSGEMKLTEVTENNLASEYKGDGSNTCFGDSGGPAILKSAAGTGVVGVTSSGIAEDCGVGDISLFANIQDPAILNFLRSVVPGLVEL